ncbi:MAG: class IV adenylate cyclase [Patescibacteria group bacterium]
MKDIEVELTFELNDPESAQAKIKSVAEAKGEIYQKDTYYTPKHKNFVEQKPISDWLRIRETDKGNEVNFKHWHNQDDVKAVSCDEYETKVEDIEQVRKIFQKLEISELVVVEKKRTIYQYQDIEIVLDQITDLGWFIELEAKGEYRSIEDAKERLYSVLKKLDIKVGEQDFKGYPHRLLEKKGLLSI